MVELATKLKYYILHYIFRYYLSTPILLLEQYILPWIKLPDASTFFYSIMITKNKDMFF